MAFSAGLDSTDQDFYLQEGVTRVQDSLYLGVLLMCVLGTFLFTLGNTLNTCVV